MRLLEDRELFLRCFCFPAKAILELFAESYNVFSDKTIRNQRSDLMQVLGSFRSIPGLPKYNPDLDYNKDSKIDLADLTTVAANM